MMFPLLYGGSLCADGEGAMNLLHGLSAALLALGVYSMALSLAETIHDPGKGVFTFCFGLVFVFLGVLVWQ